MTWKQIPDSKAWIELLMQEKGYVTDGEAAARLEVLRQSVQQWRAGEAQMDELAAARLGMSLGVNPLFVIASVAYHKAKTPVKKKAWDLIMKPIEPKHPADRKRPKVPRVSGVEKSE